LNLPESDAAWDHAEGDDASGHAAQFADEIGLAGACYRQVNSLLEKAIRELNSLIREN
jgi:hypothetical protein